MITPGSRSPCYYLPIQFRALQLKLKSPPLYFIHKLLISINISHHFYTIFPRVFGKIETLIGPLDNFQHRIIACLQAPNSATNGYRNHHTAIHIQANLQGSNFAPNSLRYPDRFSCIGMIFSVNASKSF